MINNTGFIDLIALCILIWIECNHKLHAITSMKSHKKYDSIIEDLKSPN